MYLVLLGYKDYERVKMMPILSIVIPAYNEEKMILKAAYTISELLNKEKISAEILFVNDGSEDNTWKEIQRASQEIENVRGISLSRNFGKESAILAGLTHAKGDCCIVMDCDLQHPPETIIEMYRLWKDGYDIVEGFKKSRGKEGIIKTFFAKSFYRLINRVTGFDMSASSDFKLLDRKVVDAYLQLPERKVFFRALTFWLGFKSIGVEYEVQERTEGKTKWSYLSLIKYAITNITSFSTAPMQIITIIGVLFFIFSIVLGVQSLINFFSGRSLEGFTTVILLLLGIGSVLMMSLGIIGYYIAKIYEEVKRRPRYIVSEKTNDKDE
ncbi:glycosyltransferase family 2 protein [Ureibacillus terrenus]|nr:glycosyltransferase family 2 protein [Ureibacillus terrenus]